MHEPDHEDVFYDNECPHPAQQFLGPAIARRTHIHLLHETAVVMRRIFAKELVEIGKHGART